MTVNALILVDIQNDYFEGGRWPVEGMKAAGENAARLLEHFRKTGAPIIHVRHEITSDPAPFFAPCSPGAEINACVRPQGGEPVILKHRPNSFVGTDLLERLKSLSVEAVTICGAMSQMCIDATARAAADHGFKITVVGDACAARSVTFNGVTVPARDVHAAIMGPLSSSYGRVISTEDYLASA